MGNARYWDEFYRENPNVFGSEPTPFAVECGRMLVERGVEQMVMDLGSGYGRDSVALAGFDLEILPLDVSEVAIDLLRRRVSDTPLVTMINPVWNDVLDDLPVSDDFFGAIYSWNFFNQGFSDEEIDFILAEAYRSLLPGGFLLIGVRSPGDPPDERDDGTGSVRCGPGPCPQRLWTPEFAERKLEDYVIERMEPGRVGIAGATYGVLEIVAVK